MPISTTLNKNSIIIKYIQILLRNNFNPKLRVTEEFDEQTSQCIYDYLVDRFDTPVYAINVSLSSNYVDTALGRYPAFTNIPTKQDTYCLTYIPNEYVIDDFTFKQVYICDNSSDETSPTYPWVLCEENSLIHKLCKINFNTRGFVLPKYFKELVDNMPPISETNTVDPITILDYIKPVSTCYRTWELDDKLVWTYTDKLDNFIISFLIGRVITPDSTPEEISYAKKLLAKGVDDGYIWDTETTINLINKQLALNSVLPTYTPTGYFDLRTEYYLLSIANPEVL